MDDATAIAWTMLSMKTDLRSFFHDMDEDVELPLFHHGSGNRTAEKDNEEEEDVEGKEEEEDSQTAILLDGRRRQRHQRKSGYEDTDETGTPLSPLSSLPHSSLEVTDVLEEMKRAEDDEDREALEQVEAEIQERKREDEVSEGDENDKEDEEEEDRGGGGGEGVPSPREKRVCFEDGAHEAAETPREQLLHPSCPSDERLGDTAGKICKKKGEEKDESGWEGLATGSKKTMSSVFSQTWQEAWGEGRWSAPEDTPLLPMESKRENEGKEEHRKEIGEEEEETQMHNGEEEEVEGTRQVSRAAETYPTSSSSLYSTEPALLRTAMRRQRTFLQQRTRSRLDRLLTRHYPLYRPEKAEELYEELCEEYEQKVHIEGAELPPFRRQLA